MQFNFFLPLMPCESHLNGIHGSVEVAAKMCRFPDSPFRSAAEPVRKDITSIFNVLLLFNSLRTISEQGNLLNEFIASSLTNMRVCIWVQ